MTRLGVRWGARSTVPSGELRPRAAPATGPRRNRQLRLIRAQSRATAASCVCVKTTPLSADNGDRWACERARIGDGTASERYWNGTGNGIWSASELHGRNRNAIVERHRSGIETEFERHLNDSSVLAAMVTAVPFWLLVNGHVVKCYIGLEVGFNDLYVCTYIHTCHFAHFIC